MKSTIGGQWKNKRHLTKASGSKRGRGRSKSPVFGILGRGGEVWEVLFVLIAGKARPELRLMAMFMAG